MKLPIYHVDAFTNKRFAGNPAAIIPLSSWIDETLMQQIAMENNLSETAFLVPTTEHYSNYELRWFTPEVEINLCGHATLGAAWVVFNLLGHAKPEVAFATKSGKLVVEKRADVYVMDFPSWPPKPLQEEIPGLAQALGVKEILSLAKYRDLLVLLPDEQAVIDADPDFTTLKKMGEKVIITAPGSNEVDFVSRFFAPTAGVNEDPVTGSAHSQLIPYWAEKLGKKKLHAKQLSQRGGEIWCGLWGDRVSMSGQCVFYMQGEIKV